MNDVEYILSQLQANGVEVRPEYETVFKSHLDVLVYRLQNNECATIDDMSFLNQVEGEYIDLAHRILDPLFEKYDVKMNEVEIGLFAIYMKLFKEVL
ncbi:MAG: PRD domain-containing protein [Erysipelotrichaceae bacterium]|nr:PRD domain-containing protein [Erysipelotrichaceae bacterium]